MSEKFMRIGGTDGTTARPLKTDSQGKLDMVGSPRLIEDVHKYNEGVEVIAWEQGYKHATGTFSKEADHISLVAENSGGVSEATVTTSEKIDFTNVFSVTLDWESLGVNDANSRIYVTFGNVKEDRYTAHVYAIKYANDSLTRKKTIIDTSYIKGSYFMRVHAVDASSASRRSEVKLYSVLFKEQTEAKSVPLSLDLEGSPHVNVKDVSNKEYKWLSTEVKPSEYIEHLSFGLEMDTATVYYWNGNEWKVFG